MFIFATGFLKDLNLKKIAALLLTTIFSLSLVTTGCMCHMGGSGFFSHLLMGMNCTCMISDEMGEMTMDDMEGMQCDGLCCMMEESDMNHHHDSPAIVDRYDINFFFNLPFEFKPNTGQAVIKNSLPPYQIKEFQEPILPIFIPPKIAV